MPDTSDAPNATPEPATPQSGGVLPPAAVVCQVFGSARQVALHLGLAESTPWRWLESGLVPARHHLDLLEIAQRVGLTLTADDLVRGRAVRE